MFLFTKNNHFKAYRSDFDIGFRKRQRIDFTLNLIEVRPRIKKKKNSSNTKILPLSFQFRHSRSVVSFSFYPMDCSTPGLPVYRQLPEFTQTHDHWVSDAIQLYHLLSSPSPPAFNLSQHQGFFKWVSSSQQVAKILEFQLQHQSFQWTPRTDVL